ncbi:MAG: hypothetical protein OXG85_00465 [Chloroflexi bacterium]|nr:hypothetical protein [Chloroflexota bacterium]
MPFDGQEVYQLARELGLPDLTEVALGAGVMSVLEVSAYYGGRRLRHSVARVIEYQLGEVELRVAYEGLRLRDSLRAWVDMERMEKLNAVLLATRFAQLSHQPGLSYAERSLWLIQRAAGVHRHGLMLAADRPEPPYSTIANAIDDYLPEAIREVPLRSMR